MDSTASITELAKELNLSIGTVSRILNDNAAPFAPETKRRVRALAEKKNYRPNPVARALATGRTGTVGLWIRNLLSPYDAWVARSFEAQVEAQSFELVVRLFGHQSEPGAVPPRATLPDSVDGIVTHGLPPRGWALRPGSSRGVPVVVTGSVADSETLDYVGLDFARASEDAVKHLLESGRRRVGFLASPDFSDERHQGYTSVMHEAGLSPQVIYAVGSSRAETRRLLREYVSAHGHPEALFCYNDDAAIAAYRALLDLGLRVPEDVALVGCDGIEDTEYLAAPITTIVLPIEEMSRLAWQYLKRRMQEPDAPPQRTVLEARLEIRASSRN